MPTAAFASEEPSQQTASAAEAVNGSGVELHPYIIANKAQFMTLAALINAGQPADEMAPQSSATAADYAVFGITGNYRTGWEWLRSAWYSVTCDITVTTDDRFYGIGTSAIPFNGYINFNGHTFTWDHCEYTLDGSVQNFRLGVIGEAGTDTTFDKSFLANITTKGSIIVNVPSDAAFQNIMVGGVIGRLTNLGTHAIGDLKNEADIVVNIANSGSGSVLVGGIVGMGTRIRTVNTMGSMVNTGNITVHTLSAQDQKSLLYVGGLFGNREGVVRLLYGNSSGTILIDNDVPKTLNRAGYTYDNTSKYIGGLAGAAGGWVYFESLYFNGKIRLNTIAPSAAAVTDYIGGLSGTVSSIGTDGPYAYCVSAGTLDIRNDNANCTTYLGGIYGYYTNGSASNSNLVDFNDMECNLTGTLYAGGIAGKSVGTETYADCYWLKRDSITESAIGESTKAKNLSSVYEVNLEDLTFGDFSPLPYIDYISGTPNNAWYIKLDMSRWNTSNPHVLSISDGSLTAVGAGTAVASCDVTLSFGESDVTFSVSMRVTVKPKPLDDRSVTVSGLMDKYPTEESAADAAEHAVVQVGDIVLARGKDYTITNREDVTEITFTGNYTGSVKRSYQIDNAAPEVTSSGYCGIYDGTPHGIEVSTTAEGAVVTYCETPDGDFSFAAPSKQDAGVYQVYYKVAVGSQEAFGSETITIQKKPLTIAVTPSASTIHIGEAIPNNFTCQTDGLLDGEALTGLPSVSTAADGTVAGEFPVTVSGAEAPNYAITYVPAVLTVTPHVHSGDDDGTVITAANCTNAGTVQYTCTECGVSYTVTVPALGHNYSDYSITNITAPDANGKFTVTETAVCARNLQHVLTYKEDHSIRGTVGKYVEDTLWRCGFCDLTYYKNGTQYDAYEASTIASAPYTGNPITPPVTVKKNGVLMNNDEYTMEYSSNTAVGTATVTVKVNGIAVCSTTFEIVDAYVVSIEGTRYYYIGKPITPKVSVTKNGVLMDSNEYTVAYSNNISIGTATAAAIVDETVVGTVTFAIISASSGGSSGGSSNKKPQVTITNPEDGTVTVGSDTVTIKPNENYEIGSVTVNSKNVDVPKSGIISGLKPSDKVTVTFKESPKAPGGFADVPGDSYYADAVDWAVKKGITGGISATMFNPNGICTRAQTVTFLWRVAGSPEPNSTEIPFVDVSADSYYYKAVLWAVENGITKGTTATTFSPDTTCNRGHIVTFLWRAEKSPISGSAKPFTDVPANAYYTSAVLWAVAENITKGTTGTTFNPAQGCTRAQIVTFIYRQFNP